MPEPQASEHEPQDYPWDDDERDDDALDGPEPGEECGRSPRPLLQQGRQRGVRLGMSIQSMTTRDASPPADRPEKSASVTNFSVDA